MKKVKHHEIEDKQQMQLERHIIRTSQKKQQNKSRRAPKKTRKARMGGTQAQRTENKQIKAHNK